MSRRTSILKALAEKLLALDGTQYTTNVYGNAFPKLRFWDEVNNFPSIYMSPGTETRDYLPAAFKWGFLPISIKLYTKGEFSQDELEQMLEDVENLIDANNVLVYDTLNNYQTTEMLITSITTDEGLLTPYSVGEINLQVRYALM